MRKFKRMAVVLGVVVVFAAIAVADAGATLSAPTIDVTPLASGIISSLTANLASILTAAGILAGVFVVLRMAKRWFGARSHA